MIHIRAIAERQINLDQCAGSALLELRACVRTFEKSRTRVEIARKIALPLLPTPAGGEAAAIFQRAVTLEQTIQRAVEKKWLLQAARWNALPGLGCRLRNSPWRSRYPPFPFRVVDPADALLLPVQDPAPPPVDFRLSIRVARLETEAALFRGETHEWRVRWTR